MISEISSTSEVFVLKKVYSELWADVSVSDRTKSVFASPRFCLIRYK
ncbi:hypothetical protein SynROS8604_03734 [Synechococcus sp. ROS8604]|nr:hypothetical protein SynROS8604_03734 [Synechococcus sp. ROS8604]